MRTEIYPTSRWYVWIAMTIATTICVLGILTACGLTCEERSHYSEDYIERVVGSNQACNWDDDCTNVAIITQCGNLCTRAVNIDGIDAIETAVAYVDDVWCDESVAMGCRFLTPTCEMPGVAWCDQGVCRND